LFLSAVARDAKRWQAVIDARAAFAVAIGAKPSVLTPAA